MVISFFRKHVNQKRTGRKFGYIVLGDRLTIRLFLKSTVWKNAKFTLTEKIISSNQLFSDLFIKNVVFTKFLPKSRDTKIM